MQLVLNEQPNGPHTSEGVADGVADGLADGDLDGFCMKLCCI